MHSELVNELPITVDDFHGHTGQAPLLYVWEINTFPTRGDQLLSLDECRTLISRIWADQLNLSSPVPAVCDGRGSANARTRSSCIYLPRWARNPVIVIHELAHCVTDLFDEPDSIEHGRKFLKVYLTLLSSNTQYKYPALRSDALASGLKVSPIDIMRKLKGF